MQKIWKIRDMQSKTKMQAIFQNFHHFPATTFSEKSYSKALKYAFLKREKESKKQAYSFWAGLEDR